MTADGRLGVPPEEQVVERGDGTEFSRRPGDGALARTEAVKDERVRRWGVVTTAATRIGRPDRPGADLDGTVRRLHEGRHPATAGHARRMHRLDTTRITHALCNALEVTPWQRDRALGVMDALDLTAFGSQRAIPTVALVVIRHVVDTERRRRLGLDDEKRLGRLSEAELAALGERYRSLTDEPRYRDLLESHDLDVTAVNRLTRTLRTQLEEQEIDWPATGRSPHRDATHPRPRETRG